MILCGCRGRRGIQQSRSRGIQQSRSNRRPRRDVEPTERSSCRAFQRPWSRWEFWCPFSLSQYLLLLYGLLLCVCLYIYIYIMQCTVCCVVPYTQRLQPYICKCLGCVWYFCRMEANRKQRGTNQATVLLALLPLPRLENCFRCCCVGRP